MRWMLAVLLALLALPASAHAGSATLWGCHGPNGEVVPLNFDITRSADAWVTPPANACRSVTDTIRLGFQTAQPRQGSQATLRFAVPSGTQIDHVRLGRRVTGPGYWARTTTAALEELDDPLTRDGVLSLPAPGTYVELGMRCETAPTCDVPDAGVDFSFAALTVHDAFAPSFVLTGLPRYAAGRVRLSLDARDKGIGLASASATLAGVPVGSLTFGGSRCRDLSPADTTLDLPLSDDCPAIASAVLEIDSRLVSDGTHPLAVTVADATGNVAVETYQLRVVNHPPISVQPPVVTPVPSPYAVAPQRPKVATTGELRAAKRYTVSRAGSLRVSVSCPKDATTSCKANVKLTAKLPGHKKTSTLARRRATIRAGANSKLALKLSKTARRALKKTVRARLTLAGSEPVSVTLVRAR